MELYPAGPPTIAAFPRRHPPDTNSPVDDIAGVAAGNVHREVPDVLALAAWMLPAVSLGPVLAVDVHTALWEALVRLGVGADRYHRLRLADQARDMLAAYLVGAGHATASGRVSATVRGWVIGQDLAGVQAALAQAAVFWRRELAPVVHTTQGAAGQPAEAVATTARVK